MKVRDGRESVSNIILCTKHEDVLCVLSLSQSFQCTLIVLAERSMQPTFNV